MTNNLTDSAKIMVSDVGMKITCYNLDFSNRTKR